jgi:hypothetical protein
MSQPLLHDIRQIVACLQTMRGFGFAKAAIESQSDRADRLSQRAAAAHHIPTPSYALRSGVCAGRSAVGKPVPIGAAQMEKRAVRPFLRRRRR